MVLLGFNYLFKGGMKSFRFITVFLEIFMVVSLGKDYRCCFEYFKSFFNLEGIGYYLMKFDIDFLVIKFKEIKFF